MNGSRNASGFQTLVFSPSGLAHPALAIAASRAGGLGVLDLELASCAVQGVEQLVVLAQHAGPHGFGVRLGEFDSALHDALLSLTDKGLCLLAVGSEQFSLWRESLPALRARGHQCGRVLAQTRDHAA